MGGGGQPVPRGFQGLSDGCRGQGSGGNGAGGDAPEADRLVRVPHTFFRRLQLRGLSVACLSVAWRSLSCSCVCDAVCLLDETTIYNRSSMKRFGSKV